MALADNTKWYVPDAAAGGDGETYETAYNDINTAFSALSSTYFKLNIVPTLTGVIPSAPIALSGLKGAVTTFFVDIRLTNSAGEPLPYTSRFILDGNNALTNVLTLVDCSLIHFTGLTFKRATSDNIQGLTTANTNIVFKDCDSILAGRHGVFNIPQSSSAWRFYRGNYSNNTDHGVTYTGTLNNMEFFGVDIRNNGGAFQVAVPSNTTIRNSIIANGLRGIANNGQGCFIDNCILDNLSINAITNATNLSRYLNLLIKNTPIGIIGGVANYWLENVTYYNVTTPRTTTTGKPIIGKETILDYDPTDANYNQLAKVPTRREIVDMNGFSFGVTAGIPGADVYPQDFYLDKSVVSVTAGTVITVTLKHLAATLMTGLTLKGVACTDRTVTGVNTLTFVTPDLTAGIGDVVGSFTGYDNFMISNGITAQAGAIVPPSPILSGYSTGKYAKLAWSMAATSVTYDIEIDGVVFTGYRTLSATIAMARAKRNYSFRVRGINGVGNGAWSDYVTVKTENIVDEETIALAGSASLSSTPDASGELHVAQNHTGLKLFDPLVFNSAIPLDTFAYYVKDILHNSGKNVIA